MPEVHRLKGLARERQRELLLNQLLGDSETLKDVQPLPGREKALQDHFLDFYDAYNRKTGSHSISRSTGEHLLTILRGGGQGKIDKFLHGLASIKGREEEVKDAYATAIDMDFKWLQDKALHEREQQLKTHFVKFYNEYNKANQDSRLAAKDGRRLLITLHGQRADRIDTYLRQLRDLVRKKDTTAYSDAKNKDLLWLQQQPDFDILAEEIDNTTLLGAIRGLFKNRYLRFIRRHYDASLGTEADNRKDVLGLLQKLYANDTTEFRIFVEDFASLAKRVCTQTHELVPKHCIGLLDVSRKERCFENFLPGGTNVFLDQFKDLVSVDKEVAATGEAHVPAPEAGEHISRVDVSMRPGQTRNSGTETNTTAGVRLPVQTRKRSELHTPTPRLLRSVTARARDAVRQIEADRSNVPVAKVPAPYTDLSGQIRPRSPEVTSAKPSDTLVKYNFSTSDAEVQRKTADIRLTEQTERGSVTTDESTAQAIRETDFMRPETTTDPRHQIQGEIEMNFDVKPLEEEDRTNTAESVVSTRQRHIYDGRAKADHLRVPIARGNSHDTGLVVSDNRPAAETSSKRGNSANNVAGAETRRLTRSRTGGLIGMMTNTNEGVGGLSKQNTKGGRVTRIQPERKSAAKTRRKAAAIENALKGAEAGRATEAVESYPVSSTADTEIMEVDDPHKVQRQLDANFRMQSDLTPVEVESSRTRRNLPRANNQFAIGAVDSRAEFLEITDTSAARHPPTFTSAENASERELRTSSAVSVPAVPTVVRFEPGVSRCGDGSNPVYENGSANDPGLKPAEPIRLNQIRTNCEAGTVSSSHSDTRRKGKRRRDEIDGEEEDNDETSSSLPERKPKNGAKRTRQSGPEGKVKQKVEHERRSSQRARRREAAKEEFEERDELDRYRALSITINEHLANTISDSLPGTEKKGPEHFAHLTGMIADEVCSKPVRLASYYMAASLLFHKGKVDLSQLPKSADNILQPVRDLLDRKQYQPCVHPDLSCDKMECFEQWYTLCVPHVLTPFDEAAANWKFTGEEDDQNTRFKKYLMAKMRAFSAVEEERWNLMSSLVKSMDSTPDRHGKQAEGPVLDSGMHVDRGHDRVVPRAGQGQDYITPKRGGDYHPGLPGEPEKNSQTRQALEDQLAELVESKQKREEEIKKLQAKADGLQEKVTEQQETCNGLESEINTLKGEKTKLEDEKQSLTKQNEDLVAEIGNFEQKERMRHHTEYQTLTDELAKQASTITQLVTSICSDIRAKYGPDVVDGRASEKLETQFRELAKRNDTLDIYIYSKIHGDLHSLKYHLEQEHEKVMKGLLNVLRQFLKAVNREEPDLGEMISGLKDAGLSGIAMSEQMKPFFSAYCCGVVAKEGNGSFKAGEAFKAILPPLRASWENAQKLKTDLEKKSQECSKLQAERDDCKEKLVLSEKLQHDGEDEHVVQLQQLQEELKDARKKTKQESAIVKTNENWYQVAQLSIVMLRAYLEPQVTDKSIDESTCKSIRNCLVDGELAHANVVNQLHAMLCRHNCINFHVQERDELKYIDCTACERAFQSVLPERLSENSQPAAACLSILSRIDRVVSKHKETTTQLTIAFLKKQKELSAAECTARNIQALNERYAVLEKRFKFAVDEHELTLDFVGSLLGCSLTNKPPSPRFKPKETALKQGHWADSNVIKCLHTILSPSCLCGTKWLTLSEETYKPGGFEKCSLQFRESLPDGIVAQITPQYAPCYKILCTMAEAKTLQKELEDTKHSLQTAKDEEQVARRAESREDTLEACLGVIWSIEQQLAYSLSGKEENDRSTENLQSILSWLEKLSTNNDGKTKEEKFPLSSVCKESCGTRRPRQLLRQLSEVRSIKLELETRKRFHEREEEMKRDPIQTCKVCQGNPKSAERRSSKEEITSSAARMVSIPTDGLGDADDLVSSAPQTPVRIAKRTEGWVDYEKALHQVEVAEKQLRQVTDARNASHRLLHVLAQCIDGSPPQVEEITECLRKGGYWNKEHVDELHYVLSGASAAERVGVRHCSDPDCTAYYLHGLSPPPRTSEDKMTASVPATTKFNDIEEYISLLKRLKETMRSKNSLEIQVSNGKSKAKEWRCRAVVVTRVLLRRLRSTKDELKSQAIQLKQREAEIDKLAKEKPLWEETINTLHDEYYQEWKKLGKKSIGNFSNEPSNTEMPIPVRIQTLARNIRLLTRFEVESREECKVAAWLQVLAINMDLMQKWKTKTGRGREQTQVWVQAEYASLGDGIVSDCVRNANTDIWKRWYEEVAMSSKLLSDRLHSGNGNKLIEDKIPTLYEKMQRSLTITLGQSIEWAEQHSKTGAKPVEPKVVQPTNSQSTDDRHTEERGQDDDTPAWVEEMPSESAQSGLNKAKHVDPSEDTPEKQTEPHKTEVCISSSEYERLQELKLRERQLRYEVERLQDQKLNDVNVRKEARKKYVQELQQRYGLSYFKCLHELLTNQLITPDDHHDLEREIMKYRQYYSLVALSYFAVEVAGDERTKTYTPSVEESTALEWAKLGGLDEDAFCKYMQLAGSGIWEELVKPDDRDDNEIDRQIGINKQIAYIIIWMIKMRSLCLERWEQLKECSDEVQKLWQACELSHDWAGLKKDFVMLGNRGKRGALSPAKQLAFIMENLGREVPTSRQLNSDVEKDPTEGPGMQRPDSIAEDASTLSTELQENAGVRPETPNTICPVRCIQARTLNLEDSGMLKGVLSKLAEPRSRGRDLVKLSENVPSDGMSETQRIALPEAHRIMTLVLIMEAKLPINAEEADAEVNKLLASARLADLYCLEFLNCLRVGGFSIKKPMGGLGWHTDAWSRCKSAIEWIMSAKSQIKEQELLYWGCSEQVIHLYELCGGIPKETAPSCVDEEGVELVPFGSNTTAICDRRQPLDLRLQALVHFVAETSDTAASNKVQSDALSILQQNWSWESLNAYSKGALEDTLAKVIQQSCEKRGVTVSRQALEEDTRDCISALPPPNAPKLSDTIGQLCGYPLKLRKIIPHHPGYQLLLVDHNNCPHPKFQKEQGLGTILEAGTTEEAEINAKYFFHMFSWALKAPEAAIRKLTFKFLKGVEKEADLPLCLRFQDIVYQKPVAYNGCSHVKYRDGGMDRNVKNSTIKRWGPHARAALLASQVQKEKGSYSGRHRIV